MRVVSMHGIQQRCQDKQGYTLFYVFLLPGHAPWVDLGPFPQFGIITSDMKIRGGGVKRVNKIANVDEVPA